MNIKVTIVIPTFNIASYIGRCLESVLRQTLNNIELFLTILEFKIMMKINKTIKTLENIKLFIILLQFDTRIKAKKIIEILKS